MIVELGGRGNIAAIVEASYNVLRRFGVERPELGNPWYFPGVAEYAGRLERHGIEVTFAALFDRPTPLEGGEGGLDAWFRMFGGALTASLDEVRRAEFVRQVAEKCRPTLWSDGRWKADYRRLRIAGRKLS